MAERSLRRKCEGKGRNCWTNMMYEFGGKMVGEAPCLPHCKPEGSLLYLFLRLHSPVFSKSVAQDPRS